MSYPFPSLHKLNLHALDSEWMYKVFDAEFIETYDLPTEYEAIFESFNSYSILKKIIKDVDAWLEDESSEKCWATLTTTFEYKKLLALLFHIVEVGSKNVYDNNARNSAILAARFYYKLLKIPGSTAYNIYHSQLFIHTLACLTYPRKLCEQDDTYFNNKELVKAVNDLIVRLNPYLSDLYLMMDGLELKPEDTTFEELLNNLMEITGTSIVAKLNIDKFELANTSKHAYQCIDYLLNDRNQEPNKTAITVMFKCLLPKLVTASMDCKVSTNMVRAAYVTYSGLLLAKYGKIALPGFNILLQHLCYTLDGLERAEVRQSRVSLVVGMMTLLTKKSYKSFVKWIIKLTKTSKAPHRHLALEIISKLLNNEGDDDEQLPFAVPEPPKVYNRKETQSKSNDNNTPNQNNLVNNNNKNTLSEDSETPKEPTTTENQGSEKNPASITSESIEAINEGANCPLEYEDTQCKVISGIETITEDTFTSSEINNLHIETVGTDELHSDELASSISSAHDDVASDCIGDAQNEVDLNSSVPSLGQTEQTHIEPQDSCSKEHKSGHENEEKNANPEVQLVRIKMEPRSITSNEENPDDVIEIEDDPTPLIQYKVHTVPHYEFIHAIYERAFDVSSTVRMRALTILMQCVMNQQSPITKAIKHLNGDKDEPILIVLAMRCMSDERAVVRKSAVSLVDCLLRCDSSLINKNNLGVLVSLCRDTSLLVRTAAITALSEVMMKWPSPCSMDAFLAGPLHQLSDPETKIQDLIVEQIQKILFDRVQPYCSLTDYTKELPWMFLSAITRHNMRRHLLKCTGMLAKKSNIISHQIVDILSTHLGTNSENDLNCLVLLSCVARHVDYNDVDFVLNYYYDLTKDKVTQLDSDIRLVPLVLETLSSWSGSITGVSRDVLRTRLVRAAADGPPAARREAAALAAHLQPDQLHWADTLLAACERSIECEGRVCEWTCAADVALVATRPPSKHFVQTLISTVSTFTLPDNELSECSQACCVSALGRLSVRCRWTATTAAPTLASLLVSNNVPLSCRVNALLALADICTRYTCIMEPLLSDICACLENSPPLLRRSASRAITRLLLGGYLRLRPPLYYRYCALLADQDTEVREPAEYYITGALPADSIYHNFVECIMVYNSIPTSNDEKFDEALSFDSRQLIYDIMLQRMTLVQRFNVQCKLAKEVIGYAVGLTEDGGCIDNNLESALKDTIVILRCPHMRLPRKPQTSEPADIDDLTVRVTTNIVSTKMKRTVAEVLMPAVMKLHCTLEGGQLAAYLVRLISDLLKDYKQEIEELLDNDTELKEQVARFQETLGEDIFVNKLNIGLRDQPDIEATPSMKNKRKRNIITQYERARGAKRSLKMKS